MIWQVLAFAIAAGIAAAPDLLGMGDGVADAFHILAPIDAAVAAMAASSVLRGLRRLHLLFGPAIAIAALLLGGDLPAMAVGVVGGAALAALAFPGAPRQGQYGGGWPAVFSSRG